MRRRFPSVMLIAPLTCIVTNFLTEMVRPVCCRCAQPSGWHMRRLTLVKISATNWIEGAINMTEGNLRRIGAHLASY